DALAAYSRARNHLVEQLGVEPGPRLQELESLILGHDRTLAVDRSPKGAPLGLPTGTVTFGFTDVEDSTRLWSTQAVPMGVAMVRHDELVRSAADRHGGHVFATGGDSFGIAFHRVADAAAWAVDIQTEISGEPWPGGFDLRLRIGLHTGETEERGKGYFGPAVLVAARLAATGHGGQTLISGVSAALLDGAELRDLGRYRLDGVIGEQRILQLGPGEWPPLRTDHRAQGNLPLRGIRLIGRDQVLDIVSTALANSPIVTLVGPGGIGKTELALAVARRAEVGAGGGAWLVKLADVASPDDVARAVADVLDVKDRPGLTLTQSIVEVFRSREAVLVLDNCEHIIGGAAEMAQALTEGCEGIRVLATSREGLGLSTEQLIPVAPLEADGAGVELFNERASAVAPDFDPTSSRVEVAEICRRLDGVPLAIELAAARARTMSPADLLTRLDDHLRLLTGGRHASVERHRTLRATIQWSYDLLSPAERLLFQRLSIFAGPFDLPAAEQVVALSTALDEEPDVDADIDELLGWLVERSMLVVESGPFGRRFWMLETMRQFGSEHLSDSGHTDLVAARHAQWCLDRVTTIGRGLAGQNEIEAVVRLAELWPNLRAAVDWACSTGDCHLAVSLIRPVAAEIYLRSQNEIGDWVERVLAITPPEDEELIIFCLTWAGRRYMRNLDRRRYEALMDRYGEPDRPMIRYARAFLDGDGPAMSRFGTDVVVELRAGGDYYTADLFEVAGMGVVLMMTGRLAELDTHLGRLADQFRRDGPPTCLNWSLSLLGMSATIQGRPDEARQAFEECLAVDVPERTHTLKNPLEARAALRRGDQSGAARALLSYVEEVIEQDNVWLVSIAGQEFVDMMIEIDDRDAAATVRSLLGPTSERGPSSPIDARQALAHMQETLTALASKRIAG
ncbi:MAG: AfsR/SARP family transcriptional regulator, partial [Actinomycetia bacterium]|nr:AfsR/SARP family transcriptional regulator [Actinomycetes bacterium]